MDSFQAHNLALKGNRQIGFYPFVSAGVYGDGFLLPYPQLLSPQEDNVVEEIPGGDTIAVTVKSTKKVTIKLRWPRLNLDQLAQIQGSFYALTGTTPNRKATLKRKTTDVAGEFKIEGVVRFIGAEFPDGDYHLIVYKCTLVGTATYNHETDKVAIFEATFTGVEDEDENFYDMVANETAEPLTAAVDVTAPALSSITPADNASGVSIAAGSVVIVFTKAIQWDASQFKLQDVVSATSVVEVATTKTISSDGLTVTLAYAGLTVSHNYNVSVGAGVRSRTGVLIAAGFDRQFST